MDSAKDKEKKPKWRLPGLHSKPSHPPTDNPHDTSARNSTHDSTYGSEPSSTNTPSLTGSEASRNIQPHQESFRNEQGQIVTITTTTTTTTTTVGGQQTSVTRHDPGVTVTDGGEYHDRNERGGYRDEGYGASTQQVPARSTMRERSPNPPPPRSHTGGANYSDPPPPRSPTGGANYSNPAPPRSPTGGANYSYPSRTPPPQQQGYPAPGQTMGMPGDGAAQTTSARHGGTLQGLKTAAIGLHGVGETLRGTVNSSVDRRFHASPETLAADEAVLRAGREEIESGRLSEITRARERAGMVGHLGQHLGGGGANGQHQHVKGILKSVRPDGNGKLRVVNE